MEKAIRWQQRLFNYEKALNQLQRAVDLSHKRELSELAWKTLKDLLKSQSIMSIIGSKAETKHPIRMTKKPSKTLLKK